MTGVYSSLVDDVSEIENRMKHMQRSKNRVIKNKKNALLCVVMMFVISVCVVYVATRATEQVYLNAYDATVEEVNEISKMMTEERYIEYEMATFDTHVLGKEGVVVERNSSGLSYSFNWNVPMKQMHYSEEISAKARDEITLTAVVLPANVSYQIGIEQPDGRIRYVCGKSIFTYTFSLTQSGNYHVYVQNASKDTDLEISGGYTIE